MKENQFGYQELNIHLWIQWKKKMAPLVIFHRKPLSLVAIGTSSHAPWNNVFPVKNPIAAHKQETQGRALYLPSSERRARHVMTSW